MAFNRERFLYYLLACLLGWQAGVFSLVVWRCSTVTPIKSVVEVCPALGDRYEIFVNTTLGSILGLIGGTAMANAAVNNKKREDKEQKLSKDRFPKTRP